MTITFTQTKETVKLFKAISKVINADHYHEILTRMLIEVKDGKVMLLATDSYSAIIVNLADTGVSCLVDGDGECTITREGLTAISKTKAGERITIGDRMKTEADIETGTAIQTLPADNYPDIRKITYRGEEAKEKQDSISFDPHTMAKVYDVLNIFSDEPVIFDRYGKGSGTIYKAMVKSSAGVFYTIKRV